jgi:nucleotide-binding universal stress UspA family protein
MFRRILVPLDGSPRAEEAISVARKMAPGSGASIILLRVVDTSPESAPTVPSKPALFQSVGKVEQDQAESYLAAIATSEEFRGIAVETEVQFGLVAPSILSVAAARKVDVIVICSHGFSRVTRWVMGSVAEKVARYSDIPVLVLREGGPLPGERREGETQLVRVLVSLDGSDHAKGALPPAASLAVALADPGPALLHLVQVVQPVTAGIVPTRRSVNGFETQTSMQRARQYLDKIAEEIRAGYLKPAIGDRHVEITTSVALDEDVANAIIRVAEHGEVAEGGNVSGRCDAIAMSTHGYGGLQRWAMGSVTGRVLHATRLPLMIVRPMNLEMDR